MRWFVVGVGVGVGVGLWGGGGRGVSRGGRVPFLSLFLFLFLFLGAVMVEGWCSARVRSLLGGYPCLKGGRGG